MLYRLKASFNLQLGLFVDLNYEGDNTVGENCFVGEETLIQEKGERFHFLGAGSLR